MSAIARHLRRLTRRAGAITLAAAVLAGCGAGATKPASGSPASAARTPVPRTDVAAIAARAHVPVLCWHQIRDPTAADGAVARQYIVAPAHFAAQLDALARAGYTAVTGDALAAHLARGAPLPRKPILLTFDDGSQGQWTRALPLLRRHRFTATFFVMTVVLGKPGWLTRGQVRALDRDGMTIGVHTWDHHPVTGYKTGQDWITQLAQPKLELSRIVGHRLDLFAYPYGLWNTAAFPYLRAAHITAAFQLADKLDKAAPMYTIRRVIAPDVSGAALVRLVRQDFSA